MEGAIGGCGIRRGGIAGGTDAVGRLRIFAGMAASSSLADTGDLKPAPGDDAMDKIAAAAD